MKDVLTRNMSELTQQQQSDYFNETIDKSLLGIAAVHTGLIVLKGCRAILRKDYTNMIGKVKILSGSKAGNELTYTEFVGPGMLTATILGNTFSAPPVNDILKVIEEIGFDRSSGVLLIVQNYAEYPINFTLAKLRAETKGYNIRLLITDDNYASQNIENTIEEQGLLPMLLIHKIAGAMSEEGRDIDEIYSFCNYIINSGEIALLQTEYTNIIHQVYEEKILLNLAKQMLKPMTKLLNTISHDRSDKNLYERKLFHVGHEVAIMINNFGYNQMQKSIFILEVLKQIEICGLKVKRVYVNAFIKNFNTFYLCVLNLSFTPILIKYLDFPTSVPAWPKMLTFDMKGIKEDDQLKLITPGKYCKDDNILDTNLQGPMMSFETGKIFLLIISMACKAIMGCTKQLNIMDQEFGNGDYGTSLARGAVAIETAIQENKILGTNPFVTFSQLSYIIERTVGGLQGGLYSLFFRNVAEAFSKYPGDKQITIHVWLNALADANKAIEQLKIPFVFDQTLMAALIAVQTNLTNALNENMTPIEAFGVAVKAAENTTTNVIHTQSSSVKTCKKFKYSHPQAHAVGIWMRAVYEGVKLKLIHSHSRPLSSNSF